MNLDFAIQVLLIQLQQHHMQWAAAKRESSWVDDDQKTAVHHGLALAMEQYARDMQSLTDAIAILTDASKKKGKT